MSQELQRIEPQEPENALVQYHPLPPPSLFGTSDPVEVVAKASRVAEALKSVIIKQGLISKISGKEYPRCEAWTLLGTMLGVFPVLVWTRPVEGGWEARVEAKTRDGAVVGAAEAQCLKTERNWSNRDDFALRSMAQTRATAKALRMPLGFVMTLGGFQATPAEEMDFEQKPDNANVPRGKSSPPPPKPPSKPPAPAQATDKTRAWFLGEMRKRFKDLDILQWACDDGPPYRLTPNETLEDWPLEHVPTSKPALQAEIDRCSGFLGIEKQTSTWPASKEPEVDDGELGPQKPDYAAAEAQDRAMLEADNRADAEPENEDDGLDTVTGKLEAVSEKSGKSAKGGWVRYGLKIGDLWIGTFDKNLGELAKKDKNHAVTVQFRRGEKGCDLISIERAKRD